MNSDYIQTYEDEERCLWWWDKFKVVPVPVYEESK